MPGRGQKAKMRASGQEGRRTQLRAPVYDPFGVVPGTAGFEDPDLMDTEDSDEPAKPVLFVLAESDFDMTTPEGVLYAMGATANAIRRGEFLGKGRVKDLVAVAETSLKAIRLKKELVQPQAEGMEDVLPTDGALTADERIRAAQSKGPMGLVDAVAMQIDGAREPGPRKL